MLSETKTVILREELPEVMDPKHLQHFLGIGRRKTYEMLEDPPFHIVRVGRSIKISKVAFLSWLDGVNYESAEKEGKQGS